MFRPMILFSFILLQRSFPIPGKVLSLSLYFATLFVMPFVIQVIISSNNVNLEFIVFVLYIECLNRVDFYI